MKTETMNKITRAFGKATLTLKKHSPEILVVAGIVGTVTSAVMACKATTKAGDIVEFAPCRSGAIVILEASGAIVNGAKVYYAGGAKVASSGTVAIGHAFDKATADGDLIRVMLDV